MKIKIFSTTQNNISSLEDEVNSWLAINSDFNVKDIKVTISDHNILTTIIYETSNKSIAINQNNQQLKDIAKAPPPSFQETLSSFTKPEEAPRITIKTTSTPKNIADALDELNPSSVKPGRLIQNNYSKYTKSNSKNVSEDQAYNWD